MLLDNHPLNTPIAGDAMSARFDRLPIKKIKRIEVVQGPGSSLYGGNAFLAMINVITKKGEDIKGAEATVTTEFDSDGLAVRRYNMLYGDEYDNGWQISVNINSINGDGVTREVDKDFFGESGDADTSEKNYAIDINISKDRFNFNGRYYNSESGDAFDIAYILTENSKLENEHGFGDTSYEIISMPDIVDSVRGSADKWKGDHCYFISDQDSLIGYHSYRVTVDTYAYTGELRNVYTGFSQHQIVSGATYRFEEIKNRHLWADDIYQPDNWILPTDRNIWPVYINNKYQITQEIQATVAGRYDNYSDFGGSFNPRLGLSWQLTPKYKIKMQYGTAFRAPDFASQYSTSNPLAQPNPDLDLDPEEITTYEVGFVAHFNQRFLIQTTIFRSEVEDLVGTGAVGSIQWENADYLTSKGFEISYHYNMTSRLSLNGNYTYAHLDYSPNYQQPTVSEHTGSLEANYQFNSFLHLNFNSFAHDKAPRAAGDTRGDLDGYIILNSTLIAKITEHIEAQLSVYNLTDKRCAYSSPKGPITIEDDYTAPARSFLLGAEVYLLRSENG